MKNVGTPVLAGGLPAEADTAPAGSHAGDGRTRHMVTRLLLERGPTTAAAIADELGLSPTAVRRHLDVLIAEGEVWTRESSRRGRRGRGRPAKLFLLTEAGRARFGHAYDDLAISALRFLAEQSGEQAVRSFARKRMAALVANHSERLAAGNSPAERASVLADALSSEGYAASTRTVGAGEQLCQHHCPVAHVAAEFPQLCEAETEAFAEVLGTHVQRLATIANGDAACTTHVPQVRSSDSGPNDGAETELTSAELSANDQQGTTGIPDGGESV